MQAKLAAVLAAFAALTFAGCASSAEQTRDTAKTAATDGRPCEAAELEPANTTYAGECTAQKNRDAAEKEASRVNEMEREGQRLRSEGKAP